MEKTQFIENVSTFIKKHELLRAEHKVLVTLSGGADSVALLFVLREIGVDCIVAHCNFHLRGDESMRDEQFVKSLCRRLNVKCVVADFDVNAHVREHKVSVEMACRELRYEWFESVRRNESCHLIAVAHHSDDRIETFFLNIFRGTGVAGLASIKPKFGLIVRPLLCVCREDIEGYLESIGESYIVDSTNVETEFKRNKLRNLILPELKRQFPEAETGILRTIENMYTSNAVYQSAIGIYRNVMLSQSADGGVNIDLTKLDTVDGAVAILFEMLRDYGYNFSQVEDILSSYRMNNSGKQFLSQEYRAILNRKSIEIIKRNSVEDNSIYVLDVKCSNSDVAWLDVEVLDSGLVSNDDFRSPPSVVFFSDEICDKNVVLRKWKNGDAFKPFGMNGSKKVSDLFVDMKVSIKEKQNTWVLTVDNQIVWVVGLRRSSLYLPKLHNKSIVKMRVR